MIRIEPRTIALLAPALLFAILGMEQGAHGAPKTDETIVVYGCGPGEIKLGDGADYVCLDPHAGGGQPGGGGGTPPSGGGGSGGTTGDSEKEQCMDDAEEYSDACLGALGVFSSTCMVTAYDAAIAICTADPAMSIFGPSKPCAIYTEYVWDPDLKAWIEDPKKHPLFDRPIYLDSDNKGWCHDPTGCAGGWLHGWQGGTASETTGSNSTKSGEFGVDVPFITGGGGSSSSEEHQITVEVQYDTKDGFYESCEKSSGAYATECYTRTSEMKAECEEKYD